MSIASSDQTRPSTAVVFASDDNVPPTRLKNLAASHRVQVRNFLVVPETLARDVLHCACDLRPRVQVQPLVIVIAPPDLAGTDATDSAAGPRSGWHVWAALECPEGLNDIECDPKTGGWCVLVTLMLLKRRRSRGCTYEATAWCRLCSNHNQDGHPWILWSGRRPEMASRHVNPSIF